jgi:methylase of polypeptide subunit release factors
MSATAVSPAISGGVSVSLRKVREFLDNVLYASVCRRYLNDALTPEFDQLQTLVKSLAPAYGVLFALLRQGHICDLNVVSQVVPPDALEALIESGLLIVEKDEVRTNSCLIIPVEGLYLIVSIPIMYPTCSDQKQHTYLGADSLRLMSAVPFSTAGRKCLDLCSGSGVLGLLCAARGADKVILIERSPTAASHARMNACINNLESVVEIRTGDIRSGINADEHFDLITCNPPFMPVATGGWLPAAGAGGWDGMEVLVPVMEILARHLAADGEAAIYCECLGDQYRVFFNERILRPFAVKSGRPIHAVVFGKSPLTQLRDWLSGLAVLHGETRNISDRDEIADRCLAAIKEAEPDARCWYEQIVKIGTCGNESGTLRLMPVYDPMATDPLLRKLGGNI